MKPKKQIILATRNNGKVIEFKKYFKNEDLLYEILSLADIEIDIPDLIEDGKTFADNAKLKIIHTRKHLKNTKYESSIIITDDSGMAIDALNGEPGVKTRRWNGNVMSDQELMDYCLEKMYNQKNRAATYVSCFAISISGNKVHTIQDESRGVILEKANMESVIPGMPFRALFYVPELQMMFHQTRELNNIDRKNYHLGHNEALKKVASYININDI